MATLATAHPAKFGDAITAAGLDLPELPAHLADLFERDERYAVIANDLAQVTSYIKAHI
jgi:threonine synthase